MNPISIEEDIRNLEMLGLEHHGNPSFAPADGSAREPRVDANVEAVRAKLLARSEVGLRKYGTTTERTDLGPVAWLRHAQEEALDLAVYLEAEIQNRLRETAHSPSRVLSEPNPPNG